MELLNPEQLSQRTRVARIELWTAKVGRQLERARIGFSGDPAGFRPIGAESALSDPLIDGDPR